MISFATAHPWFMVLVVIPMGLLLVRWALMAAWERISITHADHSEREPEQPGDLTVRIIETKRVKRPYPGDGVDAGV